MNTNPTPAKGNCSPALVRAFELLGKRWNGLIVSVLIDGPSGYAELRRALPRISDRVLADRLAELSEAGVISRAVCTGPPTRVIYAVTRSGKALGPALAALTRWAEEDLPPAAPTGERTSDQRARA